MTLLEKQHLFARLLPRLIDRAHELGFNVAVGEVERSQAAADAMAAAGKGISNSLHRLKLAVDLHLFLGTSYLTDGTAHQSLGEWWEHQHELCCWGGRFGDGNHYSITHGGVK